jgi:hypothetical protein
MGKIRATPAGRTAVANPATAATRANGRFRRIASMHKTAAQTKSDSLYAIRKKNVVGNRASAKSA